MRAGLAAVTEPAHTPTAAGDVPAMPLRLVLVVLGPFSAGYFLSYMFRAINAVVAPDLVRDVSLDASSLGLVTAAYLVAFALCQLPLGIALDRFGPRRVQSTLLLVAATGSVLFSVGESAIALAGARALIGLGFAGGLMAGFKAVVLWFHPSRHALANACVMSIGGLGMLAATLPAEYAAQTMGWRNLFLVCAAITVAVSALIFLVVPEHKEKPKIVAIGEQLRDIVRIYADPYFWRLAPIVAVSAGSHVGIHTLWAGPWFADIAGFDRDGVALHLLVIAIAFLVGTLLTGVIADRLRRRGISQVNIMIGGIALFMLSQVAIVAELLPINLLMWVVFGMTGQVAVLAYPTLAQHFGAARSGRAQTSMNLLLFMTAFAAQALIGAVINRFPTVGDGYAPAGYQTAFGILLALQALAMIWYFLRRAHHANHVT